MPMQSRLAKAVLVASIISVAAADDDVAYEDLTPEERARYTAPIIFSIVMAYSVVATGVGLLLCKCISNCCTNPCSSRHREEARTRARAFEERMQARNGRGWFDRWTILPVRRSNRVQRRRSTPTDTVIPVPSAVDGENEELPAYARAPPNSPMPRHPSIQQVPRYPEQARVTVHAGQHPNQYSCPGHSQSSIFNGLPAPLSSPAPSYRSTEAAPSPPPYHPNNDQNV